MKANYTKVKLCPADRDMSKEWFIFFRFTYRDVNGNEVRKPFKKRADLNTIVDKQERISSGIALIEVYTEKLEAGWNPLTDSIEEIPEQKSLKDLLVEIIEAKKSSFTPKSYQSYNDIRKMFSTWLEKNKLKNLYPQNFTSVMAKRYLNYLVIDKNYAGKSHNTQLGIIKSWFTDLNELGYIPSNPFFGIKELPEEKGKCFAFTAEERDKLRDELYDYNKMLYYGCNFLYFLLIRPKELIRIKVEDINFQNKTVIIHSQIGKNRKQQAVTIPKALEKIMYEMGLDKAPKDHYVFGKNYQTCNKKTVTANGISGAHRKVARKLKINPDKTFYSWKHTGACALYNATKDPYLVMVQARHSDIKITMIYLRSLGLVVNERIREADYDF